MKARDLIDLDEDIGYSMGTMAKFDIAEQAQMALRRMLGEQVADETPVNTGNPRWSGQEDEVVATWNPQGESHKAYSKMLADKKTEEEAIAKAKAAAEAAKKKTITQKAAVAPAPIPTAAPRPTAGGQTKSQTEQSRLEGNFMPRKTYESYFTGNQDALSRKNYLGQGTNLGAGFGDNNPYKYRNEYNQYLDDMLRDEARQIAARGGTLTYDQYFADNQDARKAKHYSSSGIDVGANMKWGASGNPYRFANEYNKYLDTKGYRMGQHAPITTKLGTINSNYRAYGA